MVQERIPALLVLCLLCTVHGSKVAGSIDIGVNYGMQGDNLPSPADVVGLFQKYNIGKVRLFEPVPEALQALRGKQIDVTIGVRNEDLPQLASSLVDVVAWFNTNVMPYVNDTIIPYITVGNEVIPCELSQFVLPAIKNIQNIINSNGLYGMRATTVVSSAVIGASYPPSAGAFSNASAQFMTDILQYLQSQSAPLLVNVYPYFAFAADPVNITLDYAQFTATGPIVQDGNLSYTNLFDAMVDSFFSAMEKVGVTQVDLVVSESGWPSAGNGQITTPLLAATYNKNFMNHILSNQGTPKRPGKYIEGFIFAMFNENRKAAGVEQNFGLFFPNMTPVYNVF
ncbi:Glycoside hydrolase family 17 [Dillenia turbinata]|uniref:Glycoside hydrolase family 17 n=1 Tax=Dillenia turbinata TaxID=194707 RepID=A0AAN8VHC9_9MAGN